MIPRLVAQTSTLLLALFASTAARAQHAVVPQSADSLDANSMDLLPGSGRSVRWLTVLDPSFLPPTLIGQNLSSLWFRRNGLSEHAFDGGSATVTITMSHASRTAANTSAAFDLNHAPNGSQRVVVYQGPWTIPSSASPAARSVGWSNAQDVVGVNFTTPFLYSAGPLCLEIVASRTPGDESRFWNMDGVFDTNLLGSMVRVGESCAAPDGVVIPRSANVDASRLAVGSTAIFTGLGAIGELASLSIGFASIDLDLSNTGIAAAGCRLRVDPVTNLITSMSDLVPWSPTTGQATVPIGLPNSADVVGFGFIAQFIQLSIPLRTSEALHCTIASGLPTLGAAVVTARLDSGSPIPATGSVETNRGPVIRFGF